MDIQKHITNSFFAVMTGAVGYLINQQSVTQALLRESMVRHEVQKEINQNFQKEFTTVNFTFKELESRLRIVERAQIRPRYVP